RDEYKAARTTTLRLCSPQRLTHVRRNPIAQWLDGLGLFGLRSHEKFIPSEVFSLPRKHIALFLRHLWATDGSVSWDDKYASARTHYLSISRKLVDDVSSLLSRLGIMTRIKKTGKGDHRVGYTLDINGVEDQQRFAEIVGCHGARAQRLTECFTG